MSDDTASAPQSPDFDTFLASQDLPVLADFWADWCAPCKTMHPVLQELARDWKGRIKVIKVDTDKKPELANRFRITAIPTLILFKEGREVHRISGALPLAQLKGDLERRL